MNQVQSNEPREEVAAPTDGLNAAQRDVLDRLGRSPAERPAFDAGIAARIRGELEGALGEVAAGIDPSKPLFVSKKTLSGVFGCEASFMHEDQAPFAWNAALATGQVAHKAIELGTNWRRRDARSAPATPGSGPAYQHPDAPGPRTGAAGPRGTSASPHGRAADSYPDVPPPPELVDAAIDSLTAGDSSLADWLQQCPEAEQADLRSRAVSRVAAFFEGWPPLKAQWHPVTESRVRVELCDGRIQLSGKSDLTLGRPHGQRAGKVIVDLKTGRRQPGIHRDDLRFYALIETLKLGTPPRALATYYLESATIDAETVSKAILDAARNRTIDGVRRYAELRGDGDPAKPAVPLKRPGPPCHWCALRPDCPEGQEFLTNDDYD